MNQKAISPLARQRAVESIRIVARAVQVGEAAVTYSDLAERLGMSRVNGQGLASYLALASAICAAHGLPNIGALVVSKASLDAGAPMPSEGSFSDAFYAASGLSAADIPAEQARVRAFDWSGLDALNLDAD